MTVEEIRESLLPWQREVFDWALSGPPRPTSAAVLIRGRRNGWTFLRAAIDEAQLLTRDDVAVIERRDTGEHA